MAQGADGIEFIDEIVGVFVGGGIAERAEWIQRPDGFGYFNKLHCTIPHAGFGSFETIPTTSNVMHRRS